LRALYRGQRRSLRAGDDAAVNCLDLPMLDNDFDSTANLGIEHSGRPDSACQNQDQNGELPISHCFPKNRRAN
jgi:hypothetical protein